MANAYIVHDGCPSFHGDTLEHSQHGKEDVVESNDAELGSLPAGRALRLVGRTDKAATADAGRAVSSIHGTRRQLLLAH